MEEHLVYDKGTEHSEIEHYDLVVLGGGPAGLTAALYAGRYNLKTLVIAKSIGGTANLAGEMENWPGFIGSGFDLMMKFKEQAAQFGAKFLETEVKSVEKDDNGFVLNLEGKEIHGKTLIVSLGTEHRKLNVSGEKELLGKGVSYCATCDGNFFRGKRVAVVGGADSAAKAALYLSDICEKVDIVYRKSEMRCEPISLKRIEEKENIEIHYHSNPTEIKGENKVEALGIVTECEDCGRIEKDLEVEGVFIEIGATPAVEVVSGIGLETKEGYIVTDKNAITNVPGCFAAGDVTDGEFKQVVTAAGEGAVAAKSAHEYLQNLN